MEIPDLPSIFNQSRNRYLIFSNKVLFSKFAFIKCSLNCCYPKSLIIISFVYKIFQMDDSYNSLIYKTSFLNSMVPIGQFPDPTRDLLLTESPCVTFFLKSKLTKAALRTTWLYKSVPFIKVPYLLQSPYFP